MTQKREKFISLFDLDFGSSLYSYERLQCARLRMSSFGVELNVFGWQARAHGPQFRTISFAVGVKHVIRPFLPLRGVEVECLGILLSAGSKKQVNMLLLSENSGSLFSSYVEWLLSPVLVSLITDPPTRPIKSINL